MISVTQVNAEKIKTTINDVRGRVQNELLPLLERLETQCVTFAIEEDLIAELIALINFLSESATESKSKKVTDKPARNKKSNDAQGPDVQNPYDGLLAVLTELSIQEQQINRHRTNSHRIRR